ncbi:MAG: S8 family serine peptidase [Actinomycetota bacterium]|nr:S8 family serine peptidase [Actinomycetota bacterium]
MRHESAVAYAEPDYAMSASAIPNDPFFELRQWADANSGQEIPTQNAEERLGPPAKGTPGADDRALRAWGVSTGTRSIVIGETDTGIDYTHPDLGANIWSNPGGIGGCARGTHGYNVLTKTCDPMDDDTFYGGHGTHVAGIMGAVGNNGIGVAGMNWQTSILPVKWLSSKAGGETSSLIAALQWLVAAKQAGVNIRVVNDSATYFGTAYSQALSEEIDTLGANNILFVTAAGNTGDNNDEEAVRRYPCGYDRPTEICVTATDNNDQLPKWANYGPHTVDLGAPGVSIYSTLREGNYGYLSGGSMASPQVAGAAALILSVSPSLSATELKADILEHVDPLPALAGKVSTGGRLNVCNAIPSCAAGSAPSVTTGAASSIARSSATLNGAVNPNDQTVSDCRFDYGTSASYGSSVPCASLPASGDSAVAVSASVENLSPNTAYHFRLVATSRAGTALGGDQALITQPEPPGVGTGAASSIARSSATLNGTVDPNGQTVSACRFDYGASASYGSSVPCASLPGGGSSDVAVSASVGGLSLNTTYHFRVVAKNPGGESYGNDQVFMSLPVPPAVLTGAASSIGHTAAVLNGAVNPNGLAVGDCHFDYGSTPAYGSRVPCASPPGSGASAVSVSAWVGGLSANGNYHFRLVASSSAGTEYGGDQTLLTPSSQAIVDTGLASAVTQTSATLSAAINPNGATVEECHFDYGSSQGFEFTIPCASLPGSGDRPVTVSAVVEGLRPGTGYHFRVVAANAAWTTYGAPRGLTTQPALAPLVQPGPGPSLGQGVLGTRNQTAGPRRDIQLASRTLFVTSSGTVSVGLICPTGRCAGTVRLWVLAAAGGGEIAHQPREGKARLVILAGGTFTGHSGRLTRVRLRLSARARALLARKGALAASATILARDPTGATRSSQTAVMLRHRSAARHA